MGKSSKDKRDQFYRLAKEQNWRARSAFKLIQLDEQFDLFSVDEPEKCKRVVDLCAAPGSWSQVLSRVLIRGEKLGRRAWVEGQREGERRSQVRLGDIEEEPGERDEEVVQVNRREDDDDDEEQEQEEAADQQAEQMGEKATGLEERLKTGLSLKDNRPRSDVKIVSVDLQPMAALEGITMLQADITHPSTAKRLLEALGSDKVDLVLSDGAPDVTGLHDLDIYVQAQLLSSALTLAMNILRPGGKFVAKIFRGRDVDLLDMQFRLVFDRVHFAKPASSRASSAEAFVVCEGFLPVPGWTPKLGEKSTGREEGDAKFIAPFLECGDLSAWDDTP